MTDEILNLMTERRKCKLTNNAEYRRLDKEIRRKCKEEKEIWLNRKCEKLEEQKNNDPSTLYKISEI